MSKHQSSGFKIRIPVELVRKTLTKLTIKIPGRSRMATTSSSSAIANATPVLADPDAQATSSSSPIVDTTPSSALSPASQSIAKREESLQPGDAPVAPCAKPIAPATRGSSRLSLKREAPLAPSATTSTQLKKEAADAKAMPAPPVPVKALTLHRASSRLSATSTAAQESDESRGRDLGRVIAARYQRSSSQGSLKENNTEDIENEKPERVIKSLPKKSNATTARKSKRVRVTPQSNAVAIGTSTETGASTSTLRLNDLVHAARLVESVERASSRVAQGYTIEHLLQAASFDQSTPPAPPTTPNQTTKRKMPHQVLEPRKTRARSRQDEEDAASKRDAVTALLALGQDLATNTEATDRVSMTSEDEDETDSEVEPYYEDVSQIDVKFASDPILGHYRGFNVIANQSSERATAAIPLYND